MTKTIETNSYQVINLNEDKCSPYLYIKYYSKC